MVNLEKTGVEDSPDLSRIERAQQAGKWIGKKLATGLLIGAGFAVPVVGAGVIVLNHAENNAKSVGRDMLDDAERRAQTTGNQWIFTFKAENTEKIKSPLESIDSKLPSTTVVVAPSTVLPPIDQQVAAPPISETTTTSTTTSTTVPQHP